VGKRKRAEIDPQQKLDPSILLICLGYYETLLRWEEEAKSY